MKRALLGLMLAVAFAGFTGCQKAKSSTRIDVGGGRSGGVSGGVTSTPSGVRLSAAVVASGSGNAFDTEVRNLLDATLPQDYVGAVSSSASDGTGVFVGGRVMSQNGGPISSISNGTQSVATNSELLLVVFDSFYTQHNLDPIPPIYLRNAQGTISGNYADISFQDSYGTIRLRGQFDRNMFYAEVHFQNSRSYDGQTPRSGVLGRADIPTCEFFRCN